MFAANRLPSAMVARKARALAEAAEKKQAPEMPAFRACQE
jgi:hypothetical protein